MQHSHLEYTPYDKVEIQSGDETVRESGRSDFFYDEQVWKEKHLDELLEADQAGWREQLAARTLTSIW